MTRRLVVLGSILTVLLGFAPHASACSCGAGDPREQLKTSDAAFIGTLISRGEPEGRENGLTSSGEQVDWRFRVEEVVKGTLGKEVIVRSASSGASCGFEVRVGERVGLFLYRRGQDWTSGLCSQISPDALRKAAGPLPAPDGTGPATLLLGGNYGEARTLALDSRGGVLGYGRGDGSTVGFSVCPGSQRAAELVEGRDGDLGWFSVAIRDVETLEVVRETRITQFERREPPYGSNIRSRLSCRDPKGTEVFLFGFDRSDVGHVYKIADNASVLVSEQRGKAAAFSEERDVALLVASDRETLIELDLTSGRTRRVAQIPKGAETVAMRGLLLVGTVVTKWPDASVFIVDLSDGRVRTEPGYSGSPVWIDDSRFAVLSSEEEVRVYDAKLLVVASWTGWPGSDAVLVDDDLYGTAAGVLWFASPVRGDVRKLREFDSPELFVLAHVPSATRVEARDQSTPAPAPITSAIPEHTRLAAPESQPIDPGRSIIHFGALSVFVLAALLIMWQLRILRGRNGT